MRLGRTRARRPRPTRPRKARSPTRRSLATRKVTIRDRGARDARDLPDTFCDGGGALPPQLDRTVERFRERLERLPVEGRRLAPFNVNPCVHIPSLQEHLVTLA